MDSTRVDMLLQYALALAGQAEPWPSELGPIHLIKYAYIGDLAYAERHGGQTFTGAPWKFYHYGPWSPGVYERVSHVVNELGAESKTRTSRFSDEDYTRYVLLDEHGHLDDLVRDLERKIPVESQLAIKRAVKMYGGDTSGLLHAVYMTSPMLHAAPNEFLDFSFAQRPDRASGQATAELDLSHKERKRRKERLSSARERVARKLDEAKARRAPATETQESVSDEEFAEVTTWLNSLDGEPVKPIEGEIEFSDGIWKSPGRWEPFDR